MRRKVASAVLTSALLTSVLSAAVTGREPVVGLPCEGCEAVFDGIPSRIGPVARLAPVGEPGTAMRLEGTVRDAQGAPVEGVVLYAYHTDAKGVYPPTRAGSEAARRHGRLRGWARTGADGRYAFDTVRPASYPSRDTPAHVHLHVIEPGRATYYLDDVEFDDDSLLTPQRRRHEGRGGSGIVTPRREGHGWKVTRDVVLGAKVPGYPK